MMDEEEHPGLTPWWCWLVLAAAIVAVSSAGVAFSYCKDVPPFTLAGWRLQLTSVVAALVAAAQWQGMPAQDRARTRREAWKLAMSGLCLAVHFGAWVWSLQHTSLAHSLLLVSTTPIILVGVNLVQREPISGSEVAGSLLAVAGCAVLAGGAVSGKEVEVSLAGDAAAFVAALAIVGHWQIGRQLRSWMPVFVYSAPVTALAALALSLTGLAAESRALGAPHGVFGWLASARYAPVVVYLGLVPGIIGHQGFNTVLRFMPPLSVSLAVQLEPPLGSLLGWLAGVSAAPGPFTWLGGAIILAATAWATVAQARRQRAEQEGQRRQAVKHKSMRLPTREEDEQEAPLPPQPEGSALPPDADGAAAVRLHEADALAAAESGRHGPPPPLLHQGQQKQQQQEQQQPPGPAQPSGMAAVLSGLARSRQTRGDDEIELLVPGGGLSSSAGRQ